MTDHPILFSAPMVRALLDGRKTMTRRVLPNGRRPGPMMPETNDLHYDPIFGEWYCLGGQWRAKARHRPGDHLWVKEAWQYYDWTEDGQPWVRYRADDASLLRDPPEEWMPRLQDQWITLSDSENMAIDGRARDRKWRTAMPRWASRITLLVTDVRVERLQDISEADACAEGMVWQDPTDEDRQWWADRCAEFGDDPEADPIQGVWLAPGTRRGFGRTKEDRAQPVWGPTAAFAFQQTWTHLHGPKAWAANPLVSVTKFVRVP